MRRKTKGNPYKEELRTKSLWRRVIHSQCVRRNPMGWHNKRTKDRWWQWWWLKFQHDPTVAHVGKQQQLQPSAGAQSPRIERGCSIRIGWVAQHPMRVVRLTLRCSKILHNALKYWSYRGSHWLVFYIFEVTVIWQYVVGCCGQFWSEWEITSEEDWRLNLKVLRLKS